MTERYAYSINDFPNDAVANKELSLEITESSITAVLEGITVHDPNCYIDFNQALTAPENTTLDGLVAIHDGTSYIEAVLQPTEIITVERTEEFMSDSTAYTEVLTMTTPNLKEGEYRILWFIMYGVASQGVNLRIRIQVDNTDTKVEYLEEASHALVDERVPRSGFVTAILSAGVHTIDIDCGKDQVGPEPWHVYKAFLELRRVT